MKYESEVVHIEIRNLKCGEVNEEADKNKKDLREEG
jgi:hypothetical protein